MKETFRIENERNRNVLDFWVGVALDEQLGAMHSPVGHADGRQDESSVALVVDAVDIRLVVQQQLDDVKVRAEHSQVERRVSELILHF
jgi:hypothetical protein